MAAVLSFFPLALAFFIFQSAWITEESENFLEMLEGEEILLKLMLWLSSQGPLKRKRHYDHMCWVSYKWMPRLFGMSTSHPKILWLGRRAGAGRKNGPMGSRSGALGVSMKRS